MAADAGVLGGRQTHGHRRGRGPAPTAPPQGGEAAAQVHEGALACPVQAVGRLPIGGVYLPGEDGEPAAELALEAV